MTTMVQTDKAADYKAAGTAALQFIFTSAGFRIDDSTGELPPGGMASMSSTMAWQVRFQENPYKALYQLGLEEAPEHVSPSAAFLQLLSETFFQTLTSNSELELTREHTRISLTDDILSKIENAIPFANGVEYIDKKWIQRTFEQLRNIYVEEIAAYDGTVAMYLTEKSQHLRVPERIFFHLVENENDDSGFPFAFLATYATKEGKGKVRHVPLEYALTEYKEDREKLLMLLSCLNKVAEVSPLIGEFVENGEMFHPLRLTAEEAYSLLKDIPAIEEAGIMCRVPNWWKRRASSVNMAVSMGEDKPSMLGFDTLISLQPRLEVNGMPLSREDINNLLSQTNGLAMIKGKWVEVDHKRLEQLLNQMEEQQVEITLFHALKMGLPSGKQSEEADVGPKITNGKWLAQLLQKLRKPSSLKSAVLPKSFHATLRPYQKNGYTWLNYMDKIGFGACLADDMGLGKTVQVLAYLEKMRTADKNASVLLVVPASLLGNWQKEAAKFAPDMKVHILHGRGAKVLEEECRAHTAFLTVTTYGMATRIAGLKEKEWSCIILDEAQAIKNPLTKQTKEIKKLKGKMRIAMTGTPIENELANLWSLFDFLNKGLLGTSGEFGEFCKGLKSNPDGYAKLKAMVAPFMLRRLKTDKKVISDLPDKVEMKDYVGLSAKQIVLYRKYVEDLSHKLTDMDGMERRGLILASLTRLKQICNHPDQYLGQQVYAEEDSGKFEMLKDICETIYEKRERVIVFTQFKEITEQLSSYLAGIFHKKGFVLHGGTPVTQRNHIVEEFQGENYVPYIVLSVRAGGTGLNLTKASHVIHFDRWWNPAVENQATDRAYRIGQKSNVMVHKLVSNGTIEEKIDAMLESKKELAENVIGSGGENWITEMSNDELMSMLRLE